MSSEDSKSEEWDVNNNNIPLPKKKSALKQQSKMASFSKKKPKSYTLSPRMMRERE